MFLAAETALGFRKRKHQDWFDQNDQDILMLIEAKRSAHAAWLSDKNSESKHAHFKQLRGQVQSHTRELKMLGGRIKPLKNHRQQAVQGVLCRAQIHLRPCSVHNGPDGTAMACSSLNILKQWTLHFSTLLNRRSDRSTGVSSSGP